MRVFVLMLLSCAVLAGCAVFSDHPQASNTGEPHFGPVPPPSSAWLVPSPAPPPAEKNKPAEVAPVIPATNPQPPPIIANTTVYVGGEVKDPGQLTWTNGLTLKTAIESVGGFADYADRSRVDVRRHDGTQKRYNYSEIIGVRTNSPALSPGDVIYVNRRFF